MRKEYREMKRIHTRKIDRKVARRRMESHMSQICKASHCRMSPAQMKHHGNMPPEYYRSYFAEHWKEFAV